MNPYENLRPSNPGNAFMQAFQGGQQQRRAQETQNALAKYATNPDDPGAMEGLAKYNPEMAIQLQAQKRKEAMAGLESHRENIVRGAQIFRQFGVKDQASYDAALQAARMAGIDLSEVPPQFDPQYVQGVVSIADAFEPQKQRQDRYIPLQPGGSLARVGPDGNPQIVFQQNDGSHPLGSPVQGGPQPGQVEDGYRFKGGNPADPNAWEPVNGGQTPQASGGFPGY